MQLKNGPIWNAVISFAKWQPIQASLRFELIRYGAFLRCPLRPRPPGLAQNWLTSRNRCRSRQCDRRHHLTPQQQAQVAGAELSKMVSAPVFVVKAARLRVWLGLVPARPSKRRSPAGAKHANAGPWKTPCPINKNENDTPFVEAATLMWCWVSVPAQARKASKRAWRQFPLAPFNKRRKFGTESLTGWFLGQAILAISFISFSMFVCILISVPGNARCALTTAIEE